MVGLDIALPKNCAECKFQQASIKKGNQCNITGIKFFENYKRHKDCPLKPLPEEDTIEISNVNFDNEMGNKILDAYKKSNLEMAIFFDNKFKKLELQNQELKKQLAIAEKLDQDIKKVLGFGCRLTAKDYLELKSGAIELEKEGGLK